MASKKDKHVVRAAVNRMRDITAELDESNGLDIDIEGIVYDMWKIVEELNRKLLKEEA